MPPHLHHTRLREIDTFLVRSPQLAPNVASRWRIALQEADAAVMVVATLRAQLDALQTQMHDLQLAAMDAAGDPPMKAKK
jgi:hypothetical protein